MRSPGDMRHQRLGPRVAFADGATSEPFRFQESARALLTFR